MFSIPLLRPKLEETLKINDYITSLAITFEQVTKQTVFLSLEDGNEPVTIIDYRAEDLGS